MLTVIYGDVSSSIYNTSVYFKNTYEPEWLESGFYGHPVCTFHTVTPVSLHSDYIY